MRDGKLAWALVWDIWVALCATGAALYAPADVVLHLPHASRLVVGSLLTAVFAIDAVLPFRRWRQAEGPADLEHGGGRPHAVRLAVDVLAALPVSLIFGPTALQLLWLLKLYRVARLFRLWRHYELRRTALLRILFFAYWLVLSTHWAASGWIALRGAEVAPGKGHRYLEGLYWTVTTMSGTGYGDVTPADDHQRLFAIAVMVLGIGVYGFIIGNVVSLLANIDPGRAGHFQRLEELSAFMSYRNIPPTLRTRIGDYYRYLWQKRLVHDETELLNRLPPGLRTEVALHLKQDLLEAVPLFREASEPFVREIALEMSPVFFLPGDYVIRAGERGRDMYFISRGSVEVLSADGKTVLGRLTAGDFFGEMALLNDKPRIASVRALEYCDLYRLERDLLERVLSHYPEIAAQIRARAQERERA